MCKTQVRYQAKEGFVHRQVAGNDVLISVGANVANFNGYITLNTTASFLWNALAQLRTAGELESLLTAEFDVSAEIAHNAEFTVYKACSWLWRLLFPIRPLLLRLLACFRRRK